MSQQGQALVAVMVVMVLLFALAGAVAIGASTLLIGRGSIRATTDDFRLRSAVNDSVAQVAGSTSTCWAAPAPSPQPTPSPIPTPLALALPSPDGTSQALCARMDGVAVDAVQRLQTQSPVSGTCRTLGLPFTGPIRVAVLLDVYVSSGLTGVDWAYLAPGDAPAPNGCPSSVPTGPWKGTPCAAAFGAAGWNQVALTCDIPSNKDARLYVRGSATSPQQVFAAALNPQAGSPGSVYLLAVRAPVAGGPMEEVVLFVGAGGANRLLYEAPLQP